MACIGKRRFISEEEAEAALALIRSSPEAWERRKVPRKTYSCDVCLGWHLTSMDAPAPRTVRKGIVRG